MTGYKSEDNVSCQLQVLEAREKNRDLDGNEMIALALEHVAKAIVHLADTIWAVVPMR